MESLIIGGKNYISSKRAAELMGYTQDYIGQLARAGKIVAERVSGIWYVEENEILKNSNKNEKGEIAKETSLKNTLSEKNSITIEGIEYISSKRAAVLMGYTQDYIGQLCRGGKMKAKQIGRAWYVPKSIVHKEIDKSNVNNIDEKIRVLGGIVEFKKDVFENK
jgi:hypothetical protein